ncbi:hypothetical protein ACSAZL_03675 [Methanosarcina sp. T3]|uniref:hypothetical protein n=1 Tax=Methanosarcina sp. T3 TaxID=3439062 RepID=UPI003F85F807
MRTNVCKAKGKILVYRLIFFALKNAVVPLYMVDIFEKISLTQIPEFCPVQCHLLYCVVLVPLDAGERSFPTRQKRYRRMKTTDYQVKAAVGVCEFKRRKIAKTVPISVSFLIHFSFSFCEGPPDKLAEAFMFTCEF